MPLLTHTFTLCCCWCSVQNGSSMAPGGTDTSIVNKLLGQFEQQSGQSVSNPGFNFDSLAQFATEQTGSSIPKTILEQIVKAKVQQVRQKLCC